MSFCNVTSLLRRANSLSSIAVAAAFLCVTTGAQAQGPSSGASSELPHQSFSSSQALVASSEGSSSESTGALPSSPAASPLAGQSGGTYDSHGRGLTSRLTFEGGGGFNAPIGNDRPFITWGGNFTVGGGYRLMRHVSVLAEYQFIDDKLPGSLIADAGAQGGHAHIWSLTLDPVIDLFPSRKTDVYVTGGGGFYRKVTSFTDPEEVEECYYFCVVGTENVVVSHLSSNQGGANFGLGITRKLGGGMSTGSDGRLKAFAEVRYLWIDTPQIGSTDGLGRTELIPVTLGVRW